jgi:hypothetical protein
VGVVVVFADLMPALGPPSRLWKLLESRSLLLCLLGAIRVTASIEMNSTKNTADRFAAVVSDEACDSDLMTGVAEAL